MISWRTRLNALPVDLGLKHYYPMEGTKHGRATVDLTKAEGWDQVRAEDGPLFIPENRAQWQRMCDEPVFHDSNGGDLLARAGTILDTLRRHGLTQELYSLGVGLAALEFHIKRLYPDIKLFCSDYGEETTRRLRGLFVESDGISQFDLNTQRFRDVYPSAGPDAVVLIHRVDPHLSDNEWRRAFAALAADGIRHVFFVPHRVLTLRYLVESKERDVLHRLKGTPLALSGYVRTLRRWGRLWGEDYLLMETMEVGYARGFWLQARKVASHSPGGS